LRHGRTHGKARIKRGGRHAAPRRIRHSGPEQLSKLVKRAALVAPAAAVVGAVVAAATSHGVATDTLSDAAGRVAAALHRGQSPSPANSATGQAHRTAAAKASGGDRAAKPGAATKSARGATGQDHSPPHSSRPKPAKSSRHPGRNARPRIRCSGSSVMLPANYERIVRYLSAHGYTHLAAAGMAGNIYQESKGNPESVGTGGGGLIGWTPLPPGFVTGNPAADLRTQLAQLLVYNQQWAQYIPALNAATSATQAADIYMNYFERPGIPAAYNREAAAAAVAKACGF
jgi:hypothetical protein